jgi:(p)ppGpp synthase/HD superfamily hydrolase
VELTDRFDQALLLAAELHRHQRRNGTTIPYLTHLMTVASLIMEDGGTEDEAIVGLLHDAVEDQGGHPTLMRIEAQFGPEVAHLVELASDTDMIPKPPWRARKEAYIRHLEVAPVAALRVSAADKLHNARSIVRDLRSMGDQLWSRFSAGPSEQLWYYRSLVEVLSRRLPGPITDDLARTVDEMAGLTGDPAVR